MARGQHPLETRMTMLADRLKQRIGDIGQSLQAPDGRTLFHDKLSQANALAWWSKHRYDQYGQQAAANLDPLALANLDTQLTRYAQSQEALGMPPEVTSNAGLPGSAGPTP